MAIETPPSMTPVPTPAPQRGDRATFSDRVDAFVTWLVLAVTEFSLLAANVWNNATEALGFATTALNSAAAASASAVDAAASAAAAAVTANAAPWVSGTTYAIYTDVKSTVNFQTYRKITSTAGGTVDPANNTTDWVRITAVAPGVGGAMITGNATLTNVSAAAMVVTPATPGLYVTLPDATTCIEATAPFSIYNAGEWDYGVKDSAGTQLGWVRAKTGAVIGLADNSAAAGVWAPYGLEKIGVTAATVSPTLASTGDQFQRIALDADRTLFLFGGASAYFIIYNASTQTWGAPTLIRASLAVANSYRGILSAADQVLIVSCNSTTGFEAVTITTSGTGGTVNTAVPIVLAGNFASLGQLIAVGTSWVISYGRATTVSAIRAITLAGTVPTIGAESALTPTNTTPAILFASGSVVRAICASTTVLYGIPYTVTGSGLAVGTAASTTATALNVRAIVNGNGNIVVNYLNTTHFAAIFKLTGTTEAVSAVSLGTAPTAAANSDYIHISAGKTLFSSYKTSSTHVYLNILTDTAGTATAGTEVDVSTDGNAGSSTCIEVVANSARVGITSSNAMYQLAVDCSGTSPVLSSATSLAYAGSSLSIGTFAATDQYGVRSKNSMLAGRTLHMLPNPSSGVFSTAATPSAVTRFQLPKMQVTGSSVGAIGAAGNETWISSSFTGATGFVINRLEAAE